MTLPISRNGQFHRWGVTYIYIYYKKMGKCYVSFDWTQKEHYKDWLLPASKLKLSAKCALCVKTFDVSNTSQVPNTTIYYKFFLYIS